MVSYGMDSIREKTPGQVAQFVEAVVPNLRFLNDLVTI